MQYAKTQLTIHELRKYPGNIMSHKNYILN